MFGNDVYAKIKSVEVKENYSVCKISTSKKNKTTGKYETDFVSSVRFVGNAHNQRPMADQRIKITSCGVTNCYTKGDKLEFTKSPQYVVFGYELQDSNGTPTTAQPFIEVDSSELPF